MTGCNEEKDIDERKEDEQGTRSSAPVNSSLRRNQQRKSSTSPKVNYEQQLLDILKEKTRHIDEDKTLMLSLVPAFQKLNDDQSTG
jgi:hypothetical protein